MLDRQKLLKELGQVSQELFGSVFKEQEIARSAWLVVKDDENLAKLLKSKKWSLLVPHWHDILGQTFQIQPQEHAYQVFAVDGSQIYYDKHQGPACYLLNVGYVYFAYGIQKSSVIYNSVPSVMITSSNSNASNPEMVNLQREQAELSCAVQQSVQILQKNNQDPFVCMFDGTLIFFQAEGLDEQKEQFFQNYMQQLDALAQAQILHVGYISFPRSKELVNILRLSLVQFDQKALNNDANLLDKQLCRLTDMDVAQFFLKPGYRSIVFESKAPISYAYPAHLKPYFCYIHVGAEIVRLEFPAWIAQNDQFLATVCAVAFDQALKGNGYPVCLFEAHEQAVIKGYDRDFFYFMIQKMTQEHDGLYKFSLKSAKKRVVPV